VRCADHPETRLKVVRDFADAKRPPWASSSQRFGMKTRTMSFSERKLRSAELSVRLRRAPVYINTVAEKTGIAPQALYHSTTLSESEIARLDAYLLHLEAAVSVSARL
jgi:hypothetical protein